MKNIFLSSLIVFFSTAVFAQTSPAETLSQKMATRMKDSLSLTETQKGQLYDINMQLQNEKAAARQQYSSNTDAVRLQLQRIENTRDSLYRPVLSEQQYILYRQKKRNLVTNN